MVVVPTTTRAVLGVVEPIPKLPFCKRVNICAFEDDETTNGFMFELLVPMTERVAIGEDVPIPTAPANVLVPVVLVACIVPNTPRVEATLATVLVVVAPDNVQ